MAAKRITVKYQYPEGDSAEVVKDVRGSQKTIQKEIDFICQWLTSHGRTVVETTVTEAN